MFSESRQFYQDDFHEEGNWLENPELKKTKEEYHEVISERDENYQRAVEKNPNLQATKEALGTHNNIVLHYAAELSRDLPPKEKAAAIIGTLLHDSGKLEARLENHHEAGVNYAKSLLEKYRGQKIAGIEIDQEIIDLALGAIERHMNHPFLVKDKLFPAPENEVDRAVYSADMLANVGFKNVGFRVVSSNFREENKKTAQEKGISQLQAAAENVVSGVENLRKQIEALEEKAGKAMLTDEARKLLNGHALRVKIIFEKMKEKNLFGEIQSEIGEESGLEQKKKVTERLNREIKEIGRELGYNEQDLQNYQM